MHAFCKQCGRAVDRHDPFTHLVGNRGWCLTCEDNSTAWEEEVERMKMRAYLEFMRLPDIDKWERVYDALFGDG